MLIPVKNILTDKRGGDKEVLLILFERCNLTCSFCHQDHQSMVGLDDIESKADGVIRNYDGVSNYSINITGGEIFLDEHPDAVFESYYALVMKMHLAMPTASFCFVTNLIFTNTDRVRALLKRLSIEGCKVSLGTSYDPCGRFSATTKGLFYSNLIGYKEYISCIGMVLTKQNIQWFLDGNKDPVFDYIYKEHGIYFDHYTPGEGYKKLQPGDAAIADLYIKMSVDYPNVSPLKGWVENAQNPSTCRSTLIVTPLSEVTTCRSLVGANAVIDNDLGEAIKRETELTFLAKYKCLECTHYQRCGLRCFLHSEFLDDLDDNCNFKRMFDAILPTV